MKVNVTIENLGGDRVSGAAMSVRAPVAVTVTHLDPDGDGVGLDDRGRTWTLRGAPVGATVLAVGRPRAGWRVGTLSPAPDAVRPDCAAFGACGGCRFQEMPLERQREEKHRALATLLAPLGGHDHGIVGAPAAYGWRNKVELGFGVDRHWLTLADGDGLPRRGRWLGFHPAGRFDRVVDLERCSLVSPAMNEVYARARADALASGLPFWDPRAHDGFFRHLLLREGDDGVLAALYTAPGDDAAAAWVRAHAPGWGARSVGWYEADRVADAARGRLREQVVGDGTVTVRLGHLSYRLSATAFFQVNRDGAEVLCDRVAAWLGEGDQLWDLYCGTGALGLYAARGFRSVVGLEQNAEAVADAQANAARNGIGHATFLAGDVEARVHELAPPDAVVVDPPRAGLHPRAREAVAGVQARVMVYVSCRATSLRRDGEALLAAGWRCTDRVAVDLFPQTGHVEVVTRWVRAGT